VTIYLKDAGRPLPVFPQLAAGLRKAAGHLQRRCLNETAVMTHWRVLVRTGDRRCQSSLLPPGLDSPTSAILETCAAHIRDFLEASSLGWEVIVFRTSLGIATIGSLQLEVGEAAPRPNSLRPGSFGDHF